MSSIMVVRIKPVQQVAAEPDTLERFKTILLARASAKPEPSPMAPPNVLDSILGWPLVSDPGLPRGIVYLRPNPRPADLPQEPGEVSQP